MLDLTARLTAVVAAVLHGGHLYVLADVKRTERENLPRGPEGAGSEGALSLP